MSPTNGRFGRIRHTVEAARANAQASAGDLESVRLSLHAELALDYFEMRTLDAEEQLLKSNVTSFEKALELTQNRYKGGVASAVDVAQAQTQLENTRTQAIDVLILRAQNEHAIATLIGQPAPTFSVPLRRGTRRRLIFRRDFPQNCWSAVRILQLRNAAWRRRMRRWVWPGLRTFPSSL